CSGRSYWPKRTGGSSSGSSYCATGWSRTGASSRKPGRPPDPARRSQVLRKGARLRALGRKNRREEAHHEGVSVRLSRRRAPPRPHGDEREGAREQGLWAAALGPPGRARRRGTVPDHELLGLIRIMLGNIRRRD